MKIFHVSDAFAPVMGGIETQVSRLAEEQSASGHEVTVLTTTMRHPQRGLPFAQGVCPLETDPPDADYRVVRSEWRNPLELPVDPRAARRFLRYIHENRPDVVHVHLGELTPVASQVLLGLRGLGVPTVVSVHSVWSKIPTIPAYAALGRLTGLRTAPFLWLCNSELTASRVRQVIDPSLVEVHNNTVDPEGWLRPAVPHAGLQVVTATRFAPRKRVPETLRILRSAGDRLGLNVGEGDTVQPPSPTRSVLTAVVAGEGPRLNWARRYVARHGMDAWVKLPGRLSRDQLTELYASSDIYLAPSVKDAFSISGLEARAAGLAILSRSQSGFGAAVLDQVEGRSVPSDAELVDTLVDWAQNPRTVEGYKAHNRSQPMPYTWAVALPKFEDAYKRAAEL